MSLEVLKLNKQVERALAESGITEPKEVQERTMSRTIGGQDLIVIGPEGCGKTTAMVLGVIMRLKYNEDAPPRALILTSDKEKAILLEEQFLAIGQYTGLKVVTLLPGHGIDSQKDALAEGADIVIGTPDRVQAVYYKSGLNVNKLKMFVLDDAELMVKQGYQTIILQLIEALPKCQKLAYCEVLHQKLETLLDSIMNVPTVIEVEELQEVKIQTIPQELYEVPNYKTKLNLLNLLMSDEETFAKVLIFVNSKITAESLHKSLGKRNEGQVALYKQGSFEGPSIDSIPEFLHSSEIRILIASNDQKEPLVDTSAIPTILHFDLPLEKELFIERVKLGEEESEDRLAITFSTDIELSQVKKIEHELGFAIPVEELPAGLIIEGDRKSHKEDEAEKKPVIEGGGAFHEKKPENAKDYNLKYKDRLKLFGKKNRKNKRG